MKPVVVALAALPACALLSACLKPPPEAARDAAPWDRPVAAVETAVLPPPAAAPSRPSAGAGDATYEVKPGDTLYRISRRFDVALAELGRANDLEEPYAIRAGQRLRIPGDASACCAAPAVAPARVTMNALEPPAAESEPSLGADALPATVVRPATAARPATPAAIETPPAVARPAPRPQPVALRQEPRELAPAPVARTGGKFHWPVEGPILARFGPREGVGRNDGINIGAQVGAPVRAAENGVVVYAGNELRGYGNLLLVRHSGGWTSAYAHNSELLVDRGANVSRGQVIAQVGRSGGVSEPQSHFELRKGADAVDPLDYLESR